MDNKTRFKKIAKFIAIAFSIFIIGGIGGVYFQQYVLPSLRTNSVFSRIEFFKRATENITVINKTEQLTVKEDDSINELAKQPAMTVVEIISIANEQKVASVKYFQDKNRGLSQAAVKTGSGVIATSDGMIITYRSAILEKDAKYTVLLQDGSKYDATLAGVDEFNNLAFLKIEASNLPVISFANSDNIPAGKKLIVIGNSADQGEKKYATGILSEKNKTFNLGGMTLSSSEKMEGVLQVDFNANDKYVGGPVVGYDGQMLGINGVILIDNKPTYFQIPSNSVKDALDLAVQGKFSESPFFGAYYIPLTKEYAALHGIAQEKGALIYSPSGKQSLAFIDGSPAEKAGVKINDIVTAINGQEVNLDNPLSNLLAKHKKGEEIELTILRGQEELKIPVKL